VLNALSCGWHLCADYSGGVAGLYYTGGHPGLTHAVSSLSLGINTLWIIIMIIIIPTQTMKVPKTVDWKYLG